MATTVQNIIDAATGMSLVNETPVTADVTDLINAINRKVQSLYAQVALPPDKGGSDSGDYFKTVQTGTIATPNTTLVALPASPAFAYIDMVVLTATGVEVAITPYRDFLAGIAELAPSIVILDRKFRSCARVGDPAAAAGLTFYGSYLPATLGAVGHFIGATTATDSATTTWPSHVGDPFLVSFLARYMAIKDGTRDSEELASYAAEMNAAAQLLAQYLGVSAATIVNSQDTTDVSEN